MIRTGKTTEQPPRLRSPEELQQTLSMTDSLKQRIRAKVVRQLVADGIPDPEWDDPRQISLEADLDTLDCIGEDDPLIEELAQRYLVF